MGFVDERRLPDEPEQEKPPDAPPAPERPLCWQFKDWRERDWYQGYPPQRPSAYWFSLATDAIWMLLSIAERGLTLTERIATALEDIASPGPGGPKIELPIVITEPAASGGQVK